MKVILLTDVKGVGRKFDEKQVSDGFAANFLIPKKWALSLSAPSAHAVKTLQEKAERSRAREKQVLVDNMAKVSGATFIAKMKANDSGRLFAALTAVKISALLKKEGIEIDPERLALSESIKTVGSFEVRVTGEEKKQTTFVLEINPA